MSNDLTVGAKATQTRALIDKKWTEIQKCLPKHVTPERMLRVIQNALGKNPKLLECTPLSLMGAITVSSELGLEVNTPLGFAYIIPYNESMKINRQWAKQQIAQFQIGYRGIMELAFRSGKVKAIHAETVYANDEFKRSLGLHRDLVHTPAPGDRGEPVGYYATVEMVDGETMFAYLTALEARKHGERFSKAFAYDLKEGKQTSPWSTSFDAMAKKTVIIQALKYAPKAIEDVALRRAIEGDAEPETFGAAINVNATVTPVDATTGATADGKKQNAMAARDLIAQYNDVIPGGVEIGDFEGVIGGSLADAPVEEVQEGIYIVRDKCVLIREMMKEFPAWKPEGRALDLSADELDVIYKGLCDARKAIPPRDELLAKIADLTEGMTDRSRASMLKKYKVASVEEMTDVQLFALVDSFGPQVQGDSHDDN